MSKQTWSARCSPASDQRLSHHTRTKAGAGGRPRHGATRSFLDTALRPDGFLILESRTGGVDLRQTPEVFEHLRAQLQSVGIAVIELYSVKTAPGLIHLVAARCGEIAARQIAVKCERRDPVSHAHTYIELDSRAELLWTAARQDWLRQSNGVKHHLRRLVRHVRSASVNKLQ